MDISFFGEKNLLAFSAGVDSSALFFMLIEHDIEFDIAIVNYGLREQSDIEERYAHQLAKSYGRTCHSIKAPKYNSHFEQKARAFRYGFFEELVDKYKYDTLITAHQLNDRLEWLLMRLSRGAGLSELSGMKSISHMETKEKNSYRILHPLLEYTKDELLFYLHSGEYRYFIDESNSSNKYERNRFRKQFSDPLIDKFSAGIKRSFRYLDSDRDIMESGFTLIYKYSELRIAKVDNINMKTKTADILLKDLGYLLSSSQRKEIAIQKSLVIGGKWAIEYHKDLLYIAPYIQLSMPKDIKERYRIEKIPAKIRPYLFREGIDIADLLCQGV